MNRRHSPQTMIPSSTLTVTGLSKHFGGVAAVSDVSFTVPTGTSLALIGPNGAGKTTVFNLITRLFRPDAGSVVVGEDRIDRLTPSEIASIGLIRTFQTARVFPGMTTLENALCGAHQRAAINPLLHAGWLPSARAEERQLTAHARILLDIAGLTEFTDVAATLLPMGAQKKLEVVRALMAHPRVLMLDEPAAGLNDTETLELATLLRAVRRIGITIILIEHNMGMVKNVADQVVVLDAGSVIAQGTPAEVSSNSRVIEAYMGREH